MKKALMAAAVLCAVAAILVGPEPARANVYPAQVVVDTTGSGDTCGLIKVQYTLNEDADGDGTRPGVKI